MSVRRDNLMATVSVSGCHVTGRAPERRDYLCLHTHTKKSCTARGMPVAPALSENEAPAVKMHSSFRTQSFFDFPLCGDLFCPLFS